MFNGRRGRPIVYAGEQIGYIRRLPGYADGMLGRRLPDSFFGVFGEGGSRGTDAREDYAKALSESLAYADVEIDSRERAAKVEAERNAKLGGLIGQLAECDDIPAVLDYLFDVQAIDMADCHSAWSRMMNAKMISAYERGDYHEMNCIARALAGEE
jgi:hypothetical protein